MAVSFETTAFVVTEHWHLLILASWLASTVAAIAGTGGGILLLPVLVSIFGIKEAVPIYTMIQIVGNLSRVWLNRSLIDYRVVLWFAAGALPFAVLGSWWFTKLPDSKLIRFLGLFLMISFVARRLYLSTRPGFHPGWFTPIGGIFSVISATLGSAGPFLAPFYLSYGLTKGAFIGTEALGTALMHLVKLVAYQQLNAMNLNTWLIGLMLAPVMISGSFLGKCILEHMTPRFFLLVVESAILGFGFWFLLR